MPITVNEIAANTAIVTMLWGENTVNITYRPGVVTEKTIAQMLAFADMDESTLMAQMKAFNELLAHLIKEWDVLENDVMFPLEPDRLAELSFMFRAKVIQTILGDIRPEAIAPQMNGAH